MSADARFAPFEAEQLARLQAGDFATFRAKLLESVQLYADTEAGRKGMGSPVMARLVYSGIEQQVDMLGTALEAAERERAWRQEQMAWDAEHRERDAFKAQVAALREALEPFVNAGVSGSGMLIVRNGSRERARRVMEETEP